MAMMATGARFGFHAALPFVAGVVLGKQLIIWPIGFGLMELAESAPVALYRVEMGQCRLYFVVGVEGGKPSAFRKGRCSGGARLSCGFGGASAQSQGVGDDCDGIYQFRDPPRHASVAGDGRDRHLSVEPATYAAPDLDFWRRPDCPSRGWNASREIFDVGGWRC